ncbi:MAG: hypothetical protein P4M09_22850 [Devosia sp.]|nr:hypothetical protein [Devosia sp.]
MSSDFTLVARQELAEVEARIAATPDGRKAAHLRELLGIYGESSPKRQDVAVHVTGVSAAFRTGSARVASGRNRSPERQKILDTVETYLAARTEPVRTGDLFEYLNSVGVPVPGTNPINNLSALLSNAPDFIAHGRSGWTLAKKELAADAEPLAKEASTATQEGPTNHGTEPQAQGGEARPGGGT